MQEIPFTRSKRLKEEFTFTLQIKKYVVLSVAVEREIAVVYNVQEQRLEVLEIKEYQNVTEKGKVHNAFSTLKGILTDLDSITAEKFLWDTNAKYFLTLATENKHKKGLIQKDKEIVIGLLFYEGQVEIKVVAVEDLEKKVYLLLNDYTKKNQFLKEL